jgi:hypothetical protein
VQSGYSDSQNKIVEERSAILAMSNETAIGQDSDHRELARFKSAEDRGFRSVISRLRSIEVLVSSSGWKGILGAELLREFLSQFAVTNSAECSLHALASSGLYEVPKPLTGWFCGRGDTLNMLHKYFFDGRDRSPAQLSFAICGLS